MTLDASETELKLVLVPNRGETLTVIWRKATEILVGETYDDNSLSLQHLIGTDKRFH